MKALIQVDTDQPFFFPFIFISWRLITLQYCSGFCHTLTWISHGFTCVPHPDPPFLNQPLMSPLIPVSLVAQMVKHLPTMWETGVQSLGREDLLEKEMATHSSILAWKIPWTEEPVGYSPWGRKESDTAEWLHFSFLHQLNSIYWADCVRVTKLLGLGGPCKDVEVLAPCLVHGFAAVSWQRRKTLLVVIG